MWSKCWLVVGLSLMALLGCGDGTVSVCLGNVDCNQAFEPVANAGPDQKVTPGALVTLDGSDSESNIQSYSWAQTAGPSVALRDANKARATFVAPNVVVAATLTFRLTVVNSGNQADTASTNVAVLPPASTALSRAIELLEGPLLPMRTSGLKIQSNTG